MSIPMRYPPALPGSPAVVGLLSGLLLAGSFILGSTELNAQNLERSQIQTTRATFADAGPGLNGYATASVEIEYRFAFCGTGINLLYNVRPDRLATTLPYWFEGQTVSAPAQPEPLAVYLSGTVSRGGQVLMSFTDDRLTGGNTMDPGGSGCAGRTQHVGDLSMVGDNPTRAQMQQFLEELSLTVNSIGVTVSTGPQGTAAGPSPAYSDRAHEVQLHLGGTPNQAGAEQGDQTYVGRFVIPRMWASRTAQSRCEFYVRLEGTVTVTYVRGDPGAPRTEVNVSGTRRSDAITQGGQCQATSTYPFAASTTMQSPAPERATVSEVMEEGWTVGFEFTVDGLADLPSAGGGEASIRASMFCRGVTCSDRPEITRVQMQRSNGDAI